MQKVLQGKPLPKPWEDFLLGNVGRVSDQTAMEMMAGRMQILRTQAENMGLQASVPVSGVIHGGAIFEMEQFLALNKALSEACNLS